MSYLLLHDKPPKTEWLQTAMTYYYFSQFSGPTGLDCCCHLGSQRQLQANGYHAHLHDGTWPSSWGRSLAGTAATAGSSLPCLSSLCGGLRIPFRQEQNCKTFWGFAKKSHDIASATFGSKPHLRPSQIPGSLDGRSCKASVAFLSLFFFLFWREKWGGGESVKIYVTPHSPF